MPFRRLVISPLFRASMPGMRPGFFTMKAMSSAGSPPMLKNSSPFSSTNFWKVACVASRTLWPYVSFNTFPSATKGCTSPREPTIWMTTFSFGGGVCPGRPPRLGGMYAGGSGPKGSFASGASWFRKVGASSSESRLVFWLILMSTRPSTLHFKVSSYTERLICLSLSSPVTAAPASNPACESCNWS